MKIKILITIILVTIPSYTFAASACLIKDKSADVLLEYIKNNRNIVKNVTKSIIKWTNSRNKEKNEDENKEKSFLENQYDKTKENLNRDYEENKNSINEATAMFNGLFNFSGYYSYFNFFVTHQLFNEVPYEVMRDYKIIDNENKWLKEYLRKINSKWSHSIIANNPCEWIEEKCDFKSDKSEKIIIWLIENNEKILDLYRTTIIWGDKTFWSFMLVDNNSFRLEIKKHYSKSSISKCNEDWWFFEKIYTSIKEINLINKEWKEWIQKWKDSWQLLIWNKPDEEWKIAKRELKKFLSNQWVSLENQEIALNNLEKYNSEWLSLNNNFLTNTLSTIKDKIENRMSSWSEEIAIEFLTKSKKELAEENSRLEKAKNQNISINEVKKITDNSKISIELKEKISELYESEIPYASVWDTTTESTRARIIETHLNIDESINILENTIKFSEWICKSPDKWSWKCE